MFQAGNMTGYEAYPPMDYMNEYNKTGMLHLKYKTMNQIEVPQMKFAKRQDKLNINIINNIDLDNVIRTNNMAPLEKISGNLIYQEIKDEDFEDPSLPKLLKTYQYALEYLYTKQSKLDQANKKLNIEYNQLINQSFEIEEKLKNNKQKINENKRMKKEHEKLLLTYESLVNFNMNPAQETNIIMKNIKSTYDENISSYEKNRMQKIGIGDFQKNARFYCHICNGKYFNTEVGLENHMKRRHLAQIRENSQREKEEMKVEEIKDIYDKKLEETKNHFQNLFLKQNESITKANLQEEINIMNREKDEKFKLLLENNKNNNEEISKMLKEFTIKQDELNQRMLNLAKESNEKNENKEIPKINIENPISNDINKLINTVESLGETLKNKENQNIENDNTQMLKILNDIKDKLDNPQIPPYPAPNKNNYNINNNFSSNIKFNPPINDNNNINPNMNNDINNNINDKKSSVHSPKNTLIDIKKEENIEEKDNISFKNNIQPNENTNKINTEVENNNIVNNENNKKINAEEENKNINNDNNNNILPPNIENKDENNKKNENQNNNIISQGDFMPNNYKESQIFIMDSNIKESNAIDFQRQKKEDEEKNEKEINISQLQNNLFDSNIQVIQNNENQDINIMKNIQNQIPINDQNKNEKELGIIQEALPVEINEASKTDPNAFKKERDFIIKDEIIIQAQKTFSNNNENDKLYNFAKDFVNRDQNVLNLKDPQINDINGFAENIIEEPNFKRDIKTSENVDNFIEKNVEDFKDLDKKSKGELLNMVKDTLEKINKINEKGQVAGFYFETMNKAIDFKMIENDEKMIRDAYNKKGQLKRTRTNSSKAKEVIEQTQKEIEGSDI